MHLRWKSAAIALQRSGVRIPSAPPASRPRTGMTTLCLKKPDSSAGWQSEVQSPHRDWTVSWFNEPPVLTKVSGRKIPFPGMQFAWGGWDENFAENARVVPHHLGAFGQQDPVRIFSQPDACSRD